MISSDSESLSWWSGAHIVQISCCSVSDFPEEENRERQRETSRGSVSRSGWRLKSSTRSPTNSDWQHHLASLLRTDLHLGEKTSKSPLAELQTDIRPMSQRSFSSGFCLTFGLHTNTLKYFDWEVLIWFNIPNLQEKVMHYVTYLQYRSNVWGQYDFSAY